MATEEQIKKLEKEGKIEDATPKEEESNMPSEAQNEDVSIENIKREGEIDPEIQKVRKLNLRYTNGGEQRTGEVWHDGLQIYREVVAFGACANAGSKTVDLSVDSNKFSEVIKFEVMLDNGSGTQFLTTPSNMDANEFYWTVYVSGGAVKLQNFSFPDDKSGLTATCIVYYTRTD